MREDACATFFHTPEWSELLTGTLPGFRARPLAVKANGRAAGVLPAVSRRRAPAGTMESMAFGTFGGPLVAADAPPGTAAALLAAFSRAAHAPSVAFSQLVDRSGRVSPRDLRGFERRDDTVQIVRLDSDYETLVSRFRPSARNKIRKAKRAGVTVRRAESTADFLAYHSVLEECSRDWSVRPKPGREFFAALSELDPELVQMWLAEHDGVVIGGDLNFVLHGTVMNWGNVSTHAAKSLAPNNLLHARAIEEGVRAGYDTYDLGSSAGLAGVRAFKASFGTVDLPIARFVLEKRWYAALRKVARPQE